MKLFLGNLPFAATEQDIHDFFGGHDLADVKIICDRETGRSRGFAFVELTDEDARSAIENLDGAKMHGRPINVKEAFEKPRGDNRGGGRNAGRGRDSRRNDNERDDYQKAWGKR